MEPSTPTPLWEPSQETVAEARITAFLARAERASGRRLSAYEHLWQWSTTDLDGFWGTVWDFFGLTDVFGAHGPVLAHEAMPGSRWFPQVSLHYAQFVLTGRTQLATEVRDIRRSGVVERGRHHRSRSAYWWSSEITGAVDDFALRAGRRRL